MSEVTEMDRNNGKDESDERDVEGSRGNDRFSVFAEEILHIYRLKVKTKHCSLVTNLNKK